MNSNTASRTNRQEQKCRTCGSTQADYLFKKKWRYCFTHAPSMAECQPQGQVVDASTLPEYATIFAEVRADAQKAREAQAKAQRVVKSPVWAKAAQLASEYASPVALDDVPEARSRISDPETSKEAGRAVNATHRELEVMKALARLGEDSSEGIADWFNEKYGRMEVSSNVSPRIRPLIRKGLVEDTGQTKTSRQERENAIWKLTPLGWSLLKTIGELEND